MEQLFFQDIIVIFVLSIAVILACHHLKIPAIVGFMLTGVLAGPHGLAFVQEVNVVEVFAEIGIILLLFSVGLEFSLTKILEYKRFFLIGGSLQVGLTVLMATMAAAYFDRPLGEAIFLGFLLSLSSTAIVLLLLDNKAETETPHGKLIISILIFQDIIAIPMMLFTPLLGGESMALSPADFLKIGSGLFLLSGALALAYLFVPRFLYQIAKTRNRELFILSVLTICFLIALLTSKIGLSLSLGAFLAGLLISESEYRHQAMGDVLPFKDIFTSFFFVSIGMLLNLSFLSDNVLVIVLLTAAVLFLKALAGVIAALFLQMPLRSALLTGIAICQIGEFSFVLAKNGFTYGLVDDYRYQLFLSVSLLSMSLTPWLIISGGKIANALLKLPFFKHIESSSSHKKDNHQKTTLSDHVIIIGFGLNGQQLALSAKAANIPYTVLEVNPETVKREKIRGEPIHFGDATQEIVLKHIGVTKARVATVAINDSGASRRIVQLMRSLNPNLYILVRTRYFKQTEAFYALGANDVIPDELGSAIEIFSRVLDIFQTPHEQTNQIINQLRQNLYANLRLFYKNSSSLYDLKFGLQNLGVESLKVHAHCKWIGKSLDEAQLRRLHGINVIAIKRNSELIFKIDSSTIILENDILTVAGELIKIKAAKDYLVKSYE